MKRWKHNFKKGMAWVLSIAMVTGMVPAMSGGANTVQAADSTVGNAGKEPSASAYATKEQMMDDTFAPNSDGVATNYGKLVFGTNSSGNPQEWYILGADSGVTEGTNNTIIFAASPIATGKAFNSIAVKKTDNNLWSDCNYGGASVTEVYANHYGASDLRDTLQTMAVNPSYFTTAEQGLMIATTVTTTDTKNGVTYTTTDKLYALQGDLYNNKCLWAGTDDSTVLAMSSYWSSGELLFWLRSPYNSSIDALRAYPGKGVYGNGVNYDRAVQPASNLNLSSVLFASSATASSSLEAYGTIAEGTPMTLRLDGTGKNIGTVTYNTTRGDIKVTKGSTSQSVALVVQGNDGTDDWFYSKTIATSETINTSTIKSALALSSDIDLSACKIWLEITDTDEMIYAVNAEKEIESINTTYVTKEQLMTAFTPDANGTATTKGKLVFGKNRSGNVQEWYILGKDTGVSGDNTIIFAASPIATGQEFSSSSDNKTYSYGAGTGYGESEGSIEVYPNHYGASELRRALQNMAADTSCFTTAEQNLMNDTTVTTKDTKNNVNYTTTDKLYALAADGSGYKTIKAGNNNTILAMSSYWSDSSGDWFRLRSPYDTSSTSALVAGMGSGVIGGVNVRTGFTDLQPASNLNLSSVIFASAATAASSDTAESDTIADGTAMTLRLDGTGKNIGTVEYSATTGDIKAVKGATSQIVALVVQGNNGTNDWYYSKQITGTDVVNVSDIVAESNTPASIDLSACKIWLEFTDSTENLTYAVNAAEATISNITSVAITDIDTPESNTALDTEASCATTGVNSTTPQITWTPSDTTAGYNTSYTASITLTADTFYTFADNVTATISGNSATNVTKNADGTLTVTYAFPATAKDKLTSITAPQPITVANGTAYSAMNLPEQVNIVTEGNTVSSAQVTWNTTTPAGGSYDSSLLTEQTVTLNGTVTCPDGIDDNGVELTTTITITISAAGIVGAPTANPTAGTYTENQSVALASSTEGATIYYTTDGSEPTITGGVPAGTTAEYTAPIAVTGTEGQSITTTIKAIAVKDRMQNSSVETFTYTIQIPVPKYAVTVTNGSGTGQYAHGETVTITANVAPSGQQFKEWEVISGTITLTDSTSETTTFTMPAEAVSVKANYEAIPATAKDKLTSITAPQPITVANGTAYDAMNLPATVNIVTEGNTVSSAQVTWNTTTPAGGSYDPSVLTEQTVTLNGTVTCPDSIDDNGVELTTTIDITISAAGIVGAPTANPTAGTYTENQSVTLTSSTEGATIYYTIDGSDPTITDGTSAENTKQYTAPIAVTGTEGQSITTTIKAIAVKDRMQNSIVETFTYTIQIPVPKYAVTVTNGSGTGQYAQGETVTITANAAPSGQQFKEWEVISGTITLTDSTSETTTFTMPAEAVSVKANYEAIPVTEYTITSTAGANGSITPSGAVSVAEGGSQTFTISPSSGYVIDTLKVDGLEVTATTSYTFSDVNANHTIEVTFKQESLTPAVTAPSITTQPGNATVKVGETATFTIAAGGTDLTYQWQIDRNDGNGWVNIANATATSYTTSTVDISCSGFKYQCVVSNSAGTVTSNTAVLTVTENTTPDPDPVDYEILDSSWVQNSDRSLSITIRGSGELSKFVEIKVDGNLVDAKNYTVKAGSTIVTLKADYLNTLSVGSHTIEIVWTDGSAGTSFTVSKNDSGSETPKDDDGNKDNNDKTNDNSNNNPATVPDDKNKDTNVSQTGDNQQITAPKTGDNNHLVMWVTLLGVSLAGLLSLLYTRKKKDNG